MTVCEDNKTRLTNSFYMYNNQTEIIYFLKKLLKTQTFNLALSILD